MSVRPVNHHMSSFAGNPSTRQTVRALDHHCILSRNGDLTSRSEIIVFKLSGNIEE